MDILYAVVVGQIAIVGLLFRWLQVQIRDNKLRQDSMMADSYTKEETNDRIDLKLKPIEVGIEHVQKDVVEIKHMLGRLLDEKNKG